MERIGHDVDEIRRIREHGGSVAFYRVRESPVQVRFGVGIGCRAHFFEELVRFRVDVHRDIESGVVPLRGMPECIEIKFATDDLAEEKRIILARADYVLVQIPRFENFHFHRRAESFPCPFHDLRGFPQFRDVRGRDAEWYWSCDGGSISFKHFIHDPLSVERKAERATDFRVRKERLLVLIEKEPEYPRQDCAFNPTVPEAQIFHICRRDTAYAVEVARAICFKQSRFVRIKMKRNPGEERLSERIAFERRKRIACRSPALIALHTLHAVGTRALRIYVMGAERELLVADVFPEMLREDADGGVFQKRGVRLLERKENGARIDLFGMYSFPIGAPRALQNRILGFLDGQEDVVRGYRFPVMKCRAFADMERVGETVF